MKKKAVVIAGRGLLPALFKLLALLFAVFLCLKVFSLFAKTYEAPGGNLKAAFSESLPFLRTNLRENSGEFDLARVLFLSEMRLVKASEEEISILEIYEGQSSPPGFPEPAAGTEEPPAAPDTLFEENLPLPDGAKPIRDVTISPQSPDGYLASGGVFVNNQSTKSPDIEAILKKGYTFPYNKKEVQVLILHTHGSEAFTEPNKPYYFDNDASRSLDKSQNVIAVGETIRVRLEELGVKALHDDTIHDYPSYNGSYSNSLKTIEEYMKKYPTIRAVIDVHRDSMVTQDGVKLRPVAQIGGEKTAQVMLVIGTDGDGLKHESWEQNLAFGLFLQQKMNEKSPLLARPLNLRKSRFNQHMTKASVILEVGSDANSLDEAKRAGKAFAAALADVLKNAD